MSEDICLGFESACEFWRRTCARVAQDNQGDELAPPLLARMLLGDDGGLDLTAIPRRTRVTMAPRAVQIEGLRCLMGSGGVSADAELHICVSSRNSRRYIANSVCHLLSGHYPSGSFCRASDGVLVSSPELTFTQMARALDPERLIAYGYELCGYYAVTGGKGESCSCPPLTSVAKIAQYLDRLERCRRKRGEGMPWGYVRARRALSFVRDGASSPEEAVSTMMLTLPRALGGYELAAPKLNECVKLGTEAAGAFGIEGFVCDMSWNDGAWILQYRGAQGKVRCAGSYEARGGEVLAADGRTVIQMDREVLCDQELMDGVARVIARGLGLRWRRATPRLAARRLRLRTRLIACLEER